MYEKLIAELRQHHCDAREDDTQEVCEECAYDVIIADKSVPSGIASVCVCGLMHRAADAIEELQKQRDEWESHAALAESFARGWIPVTERLPETPGVYMVAYHPCYWDRVHDEIKVGLDSFRGKTSWAKKKYQRVTHWMPLPEPPKEEQI